MLSTFTYAEQTLNLLNYTITRVADGPDGEIMVVTTLIPLHLQYQRVKDNFELTLPTDLADTSPLLAKNTTHAHNGREVSRQNLAEIKLLIEKSGLNPDAECYVPRNQIYSMKPVKHIPHHILDNIYAYYEKDGSLPIRHVPVTPTVKTPICVIGWMWMVLMFIISFGISIKLNLYFV